MANMKVIATNKKARFDYEILETFEAGIVLTGPEVKSAKAGQVSIKEAFATVKGEEVFLTNAHISPYKNAANIEQEPTRSRKLLLKKSEISSLIGKAKTQGLTLIPTKIYLKRGFVKVEVGLGKGKKLHDKRDQIKRKDISRDISRDLREKTK
ncbi:MAG: SsrA-binding protein SmpB [bacterium]|nr:SsrA-binding protein SmpB [bacterium]